MRTSIRLGRSVLFVGCQLGLLALVVEPARAVDIDQDGGIRLVVSFNEEPGRDDNVLDAVHDPVAQQHYCDTFEQFSRKLYITTEGTHWIREVRFFKQSKVKPDIVWYPRSGVSGSFGNGHIKVGDQHIFGISMRERVNEMSPYYDGKVDPGALAKNVDHEIGHMLYILPDEYVRAQKKSGWGRSGLCAESYIPSMDGQSSGVVCDEEEFQCSGTCVFYGECVGSENVDDGTACEADFHCLGGSCLGRNKDRTDSVEGHLVSICNHTMPINDDSVCVMGAQEDPPRPLRWCDSQTHTNNRIHPFKGVMFDIDEFPGPPVDDDRWATHNCWDDAAKEQIDLVDVHVHGTYPSEVEIGLPPMEPQQDDWCLWLVDDTPLGIGASAALLVDKSGSMDYLDPFDPTDTQAIDLALDGALYFYKQIPEGEWGGVYAYDETTDEATSGALGLKFQKKDEDLAGISHIDPLGAGGDTNISDAIQTAVTDINAEDGDPDFPAANRNMVIFSDGKSNSPPDSNPVADAIEACNDPNNIQVHTIAFGDADSTALEQLAACGIFWVTGTENATQQGFAEPDPLEMKSAIARMIHALRGEDEVLEERAPLKPLSVSTVEEHTFVVPVNTQELVFSWLANRTCVDLGGPCEPLINLLEVVELESPGGLLFPAGTPPGTLGGAYRTVSVNTPETGTWIARIDKTEPDPSPTPFPGEWEDTIPSVKVTWIGHLRAPDLESTAWVEHSRVPLTHPVAIRARMTHGSLLTGITATAVVTHRGNAWLLPMFDDGESGDEEKRDGTYGAVFNPDGDWANVTPGAYRVKVRMEADESQAFPLGPHHDVEPSPEITPVPSSATVEAETHFRLSNEFMLDPQGTPVPGQFAPTCPDLVQGESYTGQVAQLSGLALDPNDTRIALGAGVDVTITGLGCTSCGDLGNSPSGMIQWAAVVAPNAPTGPRTFAAQIGSDIFRAEGACRVCSSSGLELCNGIDDDCDGLIDEDLMGVDSDDDGVANACDNCVTVFNETQSDSDGDGVGDACDLNDGLIYARFATQTAFEWQAEAGWFAPWSVYRGDLDVLRQTGIYTQVPGSNPIASRFCGLPLTSTLDPFEPPLGKTAFYLVTGFSELGEGDLGEDSSGNVRPNDNPCP